MCNDRGVARCAERKALTRTEATAPISEGQRASLNECPLRGHGEAKHHMALAGMGTVCLADFMTEADRANGSLVQVLAKGTPDMRQAVNAVYYRNTALSALITAFLDFMGERLK